MVHPLIHLLASRPELFADHLAGYGQLLVAQVTAVSVAWRRRLVFGVAALLSLVTALGLTSMAGLLAAALPWRDMPQPGWLIAIPSMAWCLALGFAWLAHRRPDAGSLDPLLEQIAADKALLHALEEAHAPA